MAIVGAVVAVAVVAAHVGVAWLIGKTRGLCWLGYLWLTLWLGTTHPARFGHFMGGILPWFATGMGLYAATANQTPDQRLNSLFGAPVVAITGSVIWLSI